MSTTGSKDGVDVAGESSAERADSIARLFEEHNRALVGFLCARLNNEQEAKEIAQEAYLRMLQVQQPGAASFLRAYLFRVAQNLAMDRLRQRRARARLDALQARPDLSDTRTGETAVMASQEIVLLQQVIGELPSKCREAFVMHKLEERAFADVAIAMDITERMVRKHVTRALVYILLRREGCSARQARERLKL